MPFTREELAEMAAADAEIEAEFRLTPEDLERAREMDRMVKFEGLPPEKRKTVARQKAYYEANREKVAAQQKAFREANREKAAAYQKAYYEANREKLAAYQKAFREANREKAAAYQKAYYEANREKVAAYQKAIKDERLARGMTQMDLARMLNISRSLVAMWETGMALADWARLRTVFPNLGGAP